MIEAVAIIIITVVTLTIATARASKWPVRQWAIDAALFPFLAIGWLAGAIIYSAEMAYYAIITGYEWGRGRENL
jgi:hypothetical protein